MTDGHCERSEAIPKNQNAKAKIIKRRVFARLFSIYSIEKIDCIKFIIKFFDYFFKNGVFVVAIFEKIQYNIIVKK